MIRDPIGRRPPRLADFFCEVTCGPDMSATSIRTLREPDRLRFSGTSFGDLFQEVYASRFDWYLKAPALPLSVVVHTGR